MIDWHCHLLPGIDDGPTTMDEAVTMASIMRKAGYTDVYCTPHLIKGAFEADDQTVSDTLVELQVRLRAEKIDLQLHPGREYYLDEFIHEHLKQPRPLGQTKYLLIEIPSNTQPDYIQDAFYRIKCSGLTPMVAHPERCHLLEEREQQEATWSKVYRSLRRAVAPLLNSRQAEVESSSVRHYLREIGCAFQCNLNSLTGKYGERARVNALRYLQEDLYTHLGTDLHSSVGAESLLQKNFGKLPNVHLRSDLD